MPQFLFFLTLIIISPVTVPRLHILLPALELTWCPHLCQRLSALPPSTLQWLSLGDPNCMFEHPRYQVGWTTDASHS